jgi:Leucine-rich repeat (LRR) protein
LSVAERSKRIRRLTATMQISLARRGMAEFDASAFSTKEEREMLYAITKLDVSYNSLTVVKGMQCLSNLTALDISYNKVKSLAGLPLKLRRLNASHNDLKYLDGLTPLSQLEWIDVSFNEIVSVSGLPGSAGLRHVNASNNRIGSLKGIELCTGIHELVVSQNLLRKVDDLVPLRYLRAIRELNVSENPVTANPRNFAAIRLLVPTLQHLEGAKAASAAVTSAEISGVDEKHSTAFSTAPYFHNLSASKLSAAPRPKSPLTATVTPNTSSITAASSARGRVASDENSNQPRRAHSANGDQSSSLYHMLLKSHDSSSTLHRAPFTGANNVRGVTSGAIRAASAERPSSADTSRASPRRGLTFLSSSNRPSVDANASHQRPRPYIGPQQMSGTVDVGRAAQDVSVSSISAQRMMEERIATLERELKESRKSGEIAQRDADNYKLQVKQLKDTVERQAKVNAMLADANRQLSIEASRLQILAAPKVIVPTSGSAQQQRNSTVGSQAATAAASLRSGGSLRGSSVGSRDGADDQRRSSTPEGSFNRPPSPSATGKLESPKTSGFGGYASKQANSRSSPNASAAARGSISGGGKKPRRADMSPKRGSMMSDVRDMVPQSGQPFIGGFPLSNGSTPQKGSAMDRSAFSGKNVSFGGSQFYSPPQHYY